MFQAARTRSPKLAACALALTLAVALQAQNGRHLTTPQEALGFDIGDDYHLANYTQLTAWWQKLATESDRMKLVEIGKTEEGRPQCMAILTSPENQKKLARYKEIARRLALAEGLTDDQARALAHEGKAVVWIDGGLHASPKCWARSSCMRIGLRDGERATIRKRCASSTTSSFSPCMPIPDGMELVSNWYMRQSDPTKRSHAERPAPVAEIHRPRQQSRLLHVQHAAKPRTSIACFTMEWFPQIMYNHHQTGPAGAVMFAPPFRDPFNYNFDPLIPAADRHGRRGHAQPLCRGGKTGHRDAQRAHLIRPGTTAAFAPRPISTT